MLEDQDEVNEERIRRKKEKKIAKHFYIQINDNRAKIINFIIKEKQHLRRKGKVIRLISKYNINIAERQNVRININNENKSIDIIGDWCAASWGLGEYIVEYWINEIEEK